MIGPQLSAILANPYGFNSPQGNPFTPTIDSAAAQYGVPASILYNQINAESGFNPMAVSPTGAEGIAQFEPSTAKSFGLTNPFDPTASIYAAAQYDAQNYQRFGNWYDALLAYNQGPGATAAGIQNPQAVAYADKILQNAAPMAPYVPGTGSAGGSCPNDRVLVSMFGTNLITTCGLWDLAFGLVGLVLIVVGFKSDAPTMLASMAS